VGLSHGIGVGGSSLAVVGIGGGRRTEGLEEVCVSWNEIPGRGLAGWKLDCAVLTN
jgi:hypothetical protein